MFEALFASLALVVGLAVHPAAAAQDDVAILANKIVINDKGRPVEMIFDPATYGAGLELFEGSLSYSLPSKCVFGNREAKHEDEVITKLIRDARDKAEGSTGRLVARVSYCKLDPMIADGYGFPAAAGMVKLPWRSLWGEKRAIRMWYSVDDDTILLFSFVGDA